MSSDIERCPARLDSQATKVETEVEGEENDLHTHSNWCSTEKLARFSFNQASPPDNPYTSIPRHQSRIPNLKGSSPLPGSHLEFQDQFGDRPWRCGDPQRYGTPKKGDAWHKCHKLTEKYDNEMCDAWKEEVDKLLIFAGLFSATVTAFTIESYKWLSEEADDVSVRLLAFVATRITNSTDPLPPNLVVSPFSVNSSDVRINAAWFLSLTLSLSTVLIGILCLQWLREYQRDAALPHKEAVALRQMRYEGLLHWRVPEILSALPVLLQSSLILFFVGLLDLLWSRHTIVAACVSAAVGVVMLFLAATTALPALQHALTKDKHLRGRQCPYKSPQSWLCYRLGHTLFWIFNSLNLPWSNFDTPRFHRLLKSAADVNWMNFDMRWRHLRDAEEVVRGSAKKLRDSEDIIHGLQWINDTFTQSVEAVYPIYHSLFDLESSAAATTVSNFYLAVGQIDNDTLRVMLDDRFSPTEYQKRDVISAYYLHLHQDTHPVLKTSYIESVIRILNSQDVPEPFYDWLSQILQDLASPTLSSPQDIATVHSLNNPEIQVQILLCVKMLIARDVLRTLDVVVVWALLHRLLAPSLSSPPEDRGVGLIGTNVNLHHLKLACGMFEEFEKWITRGKDIVRWERVKLCSEGMLTVFNPSVDLSWLESLCPEISKALSFVQSLEVHMSNLGGPAAILLREKWWLDDWETYSLDDWNRFLENFQSLVEDD